MGSPCQTLRATALATGLVTVLLAGCGARPSRPAAHTYLEEATGSSITVLVEPTAFVHRQPGLAASGRDYVYVAPLAVSNGTGRRHWLWLGVWSTVDRGARRASAPLQLGSLQLVADDEPLDLEPAAAGTRPPGLRALPYATPVAPSNEWLVPLTPSQVQRLARARTLRLADRAAAGAPRYWTAPPDTTTRFAAFLAAADGEGRPLEKRP